MGTPDTPNVQSLVRGLAVIRTFNADRPRQTLAQVADATGLARATARRFLHTLVTIGYAGTDGTDFWLTPRVLELGYSYMSGLGLPAIAQPRLEELSRHIGESSSLSVLDGEDVVYVNRVPVRRIMTVSITIGTFPPTPPPWAGRPSPGLPEPTWAAWSSRSMPPRLSTPLPAPSAASASRASPSSNSSRACVLAAPVHSRRHGGGGGQRLDALWSTTWRSCTTASPALNDTA